MTQRVSVSESGAYELRRPSLQTQKCVGLFIAIQRQFPLNGLIHISSAGSKL